MKTVLVTGGSGFIGSNFIHLMLRKHIEYQLINLDALTYAGNPENLRDVENHPQYRFIQADIRNRKEVFKIFDQNKIDYVVHFAAESHVDRSIIEPEVFLTTNVIGTQVLLDAAKNHWKLNPEDKYSKAYKQGVRFHQVSTDEVYGALDQTGKFYEAMPLMPNSPYSASKAGADLLVRAYHQTFGLPVTISRCSNNYGPCQFPEKLIPLIIHNCRHDKPLPVYGDGLQVRDWLHVEDHCEAIDRILHSGKDGEIYNVGANNEKTNLDIVRFILQALGKSEKLIQHVKDRPGHDRRYAIDSTKLVTELEWRPRYTFEQGMNETVQWYLNHTSWEQSVINGEYMNYCVKMYE